MKKYRITCSTDPYHASRTAKPRGCEVLLKFGPTPVKWVHDDNYGYGFTLNAARAKLMSYAKEDSYSWGNPVSHKFMSMSYESDVYMYSIEEF